ncbi:RHS repeat-associated core domain protein [Bernardetia litoralis DSM 6794]|uniref:RHS repeat-associated core domain protein n=1 Tax=Bernardetia litoralis (strain ATCC 23117 / DSM 6794 / NBRC 15988 / NCIMB 1366 / Fx l1 / Sio-4) TaxID=880071 RepID=I4AFB7_BERLS|nr:RHS repeat-associated core domain-containing protein [Bernardetia litoralis]AFM02652.1 RHS repeat-associated core domain protein [Bernardetia litoralis DSM 6794]
MRELKRAKRAKSLEPDSYHVPRGELVLQLRDSTDSLIVEKRQKITISATVSWQKLLSEFTAEEDGNLTVFIDNQDTEAVYFDELELRVERQPTLVITQEHHYYPFGMNMSGIERDGELKYQFNGMIEREEAFGLELYETPFRSYDAQLGRFWQVELLADEFHSISMFQFAFNNPINFNDPTGLNPIGDDKDQKQEDGTDFPQWLLDLADDHAAHGIRKHHFLPTSLDLSTPAGLGDLHQGGRGFQPYGTRATQMSTITIFNLNNDPNVTKGIVKVRKFLSQNEIKINVQEKREMDLNIMNPNAIQNPATLAQGINAAYLIGEGDKLIKYTEKISKAFAFASRTVAKGTSYDDVELATGWKYDTRANNMGVGLIPYAKRGAFNFNIGVIGTQRVYPGHYNPTGFIGENMSPVESFALIILHVIGHNAGLDHPLFGSKLSILTDGTELEKAIRGGNSFSQFTNMTTPANEQWLRYVKHYFSSTGGYPLLESN